MGAGDMAFVLFMFGALMVGVVVLAIGEAIAPYFRPGAAWRRRERQRRRRERRR